MKKMFLVLIAAIFVLSACAPAAGTNPPAAQAPQTAQPEATLPASAPAAPAKANQANCGGGACVADLTVWEDSDYLMLLFEMENEEGGFLMLSSPEYGRDIAANISLVNADGTEKSIFSANLPSNDIKCFTGPDIPWKNGVTATVCGYSFDLKTLTPAPSVGDKIHVVLPEYDNFDRVVTIAKEG